MKAVVCLLVGLLCFSGLAFGKDVYVKGYVKRDGTYVQPHYRTTPNGTKNDNYSTKGNFNPYTGKEGTKDGDDSYYSNDSYGSSNDSSELDN